ncbi:hypothetical protein OIC43_37105 [Streptomyces sp. NBC_00825]|uniref:hypothetical protein n=1 Tax=unclassified Streptomyces TaxID=2593676 RepID=UPI002ED65284|nr:hypothetical protein OG832_06585 [Streptomyces sp. NBC_00826]WTH94256.1 hypothetical protein OIC43_37105 [Streptomyces sp. NBC_00825]WTI02991.1 hypothetical protein OHA23_37085 [Streptomyces sp. NBC_00822]
MTTMFEVNTAPVPSTFDMPCIACEITDGDSAASNLVEAGSGLGLAACAGHTDLTVQVMATLTSYGPAGLRAAFVTAGLLL